VPKALTTWLQVLVWACAALSAITALTGVAVVGKIDALESAVTSFEARTALDELVDAGESFDGASALSGVAGVATLVVLMVWMWKAHNATSALQPGGRRFGPGWSVGGWFVPLGNLVIPKRALNETERIANAERRGGVVDPQWRDRKASSAGMVWWFLLIGGLVVDRVGSGIADSALSSPTSTLDDLRTGVGVSLVGSGLLAAAGICGAMYFRQLGARLTLAALAAPDAPAVAN
jgi:hypothetical protein